MNWIPDHNLKVSRVRNDKTGVPRLFTVSSGDLNSSGEHTFMKELDMKTNPCRKKKLFQIAGKLVSVITLFFFSAGYVFALPAGQQMVNGQASFNTQGNNLTITNSPNAIINWQGFSISNNEAVRFIQQSGSSAVLNRVIGQDPSRILGLLQSNGRVFLINPNGILFGQGARIDVNGLVASTLNISNQDFLAGKYNFTAGSSAGAIENQGTITTPTGGKVYLIAPDITNSGIINSPQGDITLAAGHSVYLVDSLDPDISVVVSAPADRAVNLGQIVAQSGKVGIYGGLIQQKGVINADSAVAEGGRIFLKATKAIELADSSVISADGIKGGQIVAITAEDGQISGTLTGRGLISAQGDGTSGSGGFIETSAAKVDLNGIRVRTNGGNWLIDPPLTDFTIAPTGGDITGADVSNALSSGNMTYLSSGGGSGSNGDIFVNDIINWSIYKLTLNAQNNITINSALNGTGSAQLALYYGQSSAGGGTAKYSVNAPVNLPTGENFFTKLGSDSSLKTYYVINSLGAAGDATGGTNQTLQGIARAGNLSGKYVLGSNIDASATTTWNSNGSGGYYGFEPIATFTGIFDGLGHTITGLYIKRTSGSYVGLFGQTDSAAIIRNVGLANVNITGTHNTGGLVGLNYGSITNSYTTGSVTGTEDSGGLVGDNDSYGSITNSYSTAKVTGTVDVGGLVGEYGDTSNNTTISNSYSTGYVTGTNYFGGLIGNNGNDIATITGSFWDKSTSGQSAGVGSGIATGVTGKTTAEMMTTGTFTGWDFTSTWGIVEGKSYPYLKWQFSSTPQIISGMVNVTGAGKTIQTAVNGSLLATTSTGANGFYYFALPGGSVSSGSALLAYISGNAVKGAAAYLSGGTHITNLSLNSGTLIAGGGTMSNTTFGDAKGVLSSSDIPYTFSGNNMTLSSGFNFLTAAGATFALNGNITTANGSQTYNGPVTLASNAVLTNTGTGGNISFSGAVTGATRNLTLNTTGTVSQTASITAAGLELLGTGATYNLTDTGNTITTLAGNTGTVNFKDSTGLAIGTVNTAGLATTGDLTLNATGDITLNALINAGTGNVTLSSGGKIINGMGSSRSISAGYLTAEAVSGIGSGDPIMTGVSNLNAINTTSNNIQIDNTGVLTVSRLSNGGSGNVDLKNIGAITTSGVSSNFQSGGTFSITAHSPLTIGSGGVSASGNIALEAAVSGDLTINGNITSSTGNITLTAGGSIIGASGKLSAPYGTITMTDGNSSSSGTGSTGNSTATSNTLVALKTTVESKDDSDKKEDEDKKKKKEGGEQTSDDKKKEPKAKNYCN